MAFGVGQAPRGGKKKVRKRGQKVKAIKYESEEDDGEGKGEGDGGEMEDSAEKETIMNIGIDTPSDEEVKHEDLEDDEYDVVE